MERDEFAPVDVVARREPRRNRKTEFAPPLAEFVQGPITCGRITDKLTVRYARNTVDEAIVGDDVEIQTCQIGITAIAVAVGEGLDSGAMMRFRPVAKLTFQGVSCLNRESQIIRNSALVADDIP